MGSTNKWTVILVTVGSVLAASSGSFLIESTITAWGFPIVFAILALVLGGLLFLIGTRWQEWRAKKMGIFMSAFAVGPTYQWTRVNQETSSFAIWAKRKNPLARILHPTTMVVNTSRDMDRFEESIRSSLVQADALVPGGPDFTLKVGGQHDASFYLGTALRSTTGVTGRVWVVTDCSIEYAEDFVHVAHFFPADPGNPIEQERDLTRLTAPERRTTPTWVDQEQGQVVVPIMTFPESKPESGLFCRVDGLWVECDHRQQHQTVIVAFDPQEPPAADNRVSRALDYTRTDFPDPVLAFVGMEGLGSTFESYAETLKLVQDSAKRARDAANLHAGLFVALLGPPAFAVALGARLGEPGSNWQALRYTPGKGYEPSPLRPQP